MTIDTELREGFPEIDWDDPIPITVYDDDGSSLTVYACRLCIARYGIKASAILAGDAVGLAWKHPDGFIEHMATVHGS